MAVLVAAVILLGALVLLNLLLTAAIIRKLRALPPGPPGAGHAADSAAPTHLPVGAEVPAFIAVTDDGTKITSAAFPGRRTLVAFFTSDCGVCVTKVPGFGQAARDLAAAGAADGTAQAVAVVSVERRDPAPLLSALAELGDDVAVIVEEGRGPVAAAFEVGTYPWVFLVGPDGRVAATDAAPESCVPAPARA